MMSVQQKKFQVKLASCCHPKQYVKLVILRSHIAIVHKTRKSYKENTIKQPGLTVPGTKDTHLKPEEDMA